MRGRWGLGRLRWGRLLSVVLMRAGQTRVTMVSRCPDPGVPRDSELSVGLLAAAVSSLEDAKYGSS